MPAPPMCLTEPSPPYARALSGSIDWDPALFRCNTFEMEWPRGSGRVQRFPEVDRAEWFDVPEAVRRILPGQRPFIEELDERLSPPLSP